jgi:hypothetical protein
LATDSNDGGKSGSELAGSVRELWLAFLFLSLV